MFSVVSTTIFCGTVQTLAVAAPGTHSRAHTTHLMSGAGKRLDQGAPEQAGRADDKDAHAGEARSKKNKKKFVGCAASPASSAAAEAAATRLSSPALQ